MKAGLRFLTPSRILAAVLAAACLVSSGCAGAKKKEPVTQAAAKPDSAAVAAARAADSAGKAAARRTDSLRLTQQEMSRLSEATKVLLQAIDNYVEVLPAHIKTPEIVMLKGHTLYNNGLFNRARQVYQTVLTRYKKSPEVPEAIKMTAQTYYEENKYDEAQNWYKKLQGVATTGEDKEEATKRLAESHYKLAERLKEAGKADLALSEYEKVVVEYPSSRLADAALFNTGLIYDDKKEWSKAILTYNKLISAYPKSSYLENSFFKTGRCYEQMGNWDKAALTYVEILQRFPDSKNLPDALFNSGLAYEKAENPTLAAKAFEKYAALWPDAKDAPDVLFRAGELYGKLSDWENVEKINSLFGTRYGQDKERIVMALCMTGVASYMQKKYDRALVEFGNAIATGKKLNVESKTNAFYMAKAQYSIGEINQWMGDQIALVMPESEYKARLNRKVMYLQNAVAAYTAVSEYKLLDWTTKAIYRIGETFEQFGVALHKRERPKNLDTRRVFALEEGIAQAVEEYLAGKALSAHDQNVKFGLQYNYTDEWTEKSRQQLTKLPFLAGATYSKLISVLDVQASPAKKTDNPLIIMREKLERLQMIAPYQDKAIKLFLQTLEMGAKYGLQDKYRSSAAGEITRMSFQVGEVYAEVIAMARSAPIPASYDPYTRFFYKVKLLNEGLIEYENSALEALYKTIKISEAYEIKDEWVQKSKEKITEVLFKRALCYEVLSEEALRSPPIPPDATEDEKEEYKAQFEELGFKLQEEAQGIYRDIFEKGARGITSGEFLDLAYVRLYLSFPNEVGGRLENDTIITVSTGKDWRFSVASPVGWFEAKYEDSTWENVKKGVKPDSVNLVDASLPMVGVWGGTVENGVFVRAREVKLRGAFTTVSQPVNASVEFAATGEYVVFINGRPLPSDSVERAEPWNRCRKKKGIESFLVKGRNSIAVQVANNGIPDAFGFFMNLVYQDKSSQVVPKLPSREKPMTMSELRALNLQFPVIPNFEYPAGMFKI